MATMLITLVAGCTSVAPVRYTAPVRPAAPPAPTTTTAKTPDTPAIRSAFLGPGARDTIALKLTVDTNARDPAQPTFTVMLLPRQREGNRATAVPLATDRHYPAGGNLAVWRDGRRIWQLDPWAEQQGAKPAGATTSPVTVAPGGGHFFIFRPSDLFSEESDRSVIMLPAPENLSENPFHTPGRYRVLYELRCASGPPLQSNPVEFTIR